MNYRKAFSTIEYAFLIAVIAAALIGASVYVKRALSGKWREAADTFGHGRQYVKGTSPSSPSLPATPPSSYPCETTFYQTCVARRDDGGFNLFFHFDVGKNESEPVHIQHYARYGTYEKKTDWGNFEPGRYWFRVTIEKWAGISEDYFIKDGVKIKMPDIYHGRESNSITSDWCDCTYRSARCGWDEEWYKPLCQ